MILMETVVHEFLDEYSYVHKVFISWYAVIVE